MVNKKELDSNSNSSKSPIENPEEIQQLKKTLNKTKNFLTKNFDYLISVSILPTQVIPLLIDEEEAPTESKEHTHLLVLLPNEKEKEKNKIKEKTIEYIKKSKEKIWIHVYTPMDVWEICMDQKFELSSAIAMSYPLHDTGLLGALRMAEIHKSLVLKKFEKYVVSYVIAGSLVRGEAVDTSDIDVFVIINDTDVKRMPRRELLERLRGIIYQYVAEAAQFAGVQNKLEPQIYLLTDFWDSVKDAHPVMFTFIRDGVPLYDRGTFMPWKALLRMGKLKPSPEAIDMFMSMGDNVIPRSKKTLLSDIFTNIFWGVTTPAQAILMLNGCPPPNAKKELLREFKKEFYDKGMIEKKYLNFLSKVIDIWRDYEHGKIQEISGTKIDKLLKETEEYLKRLKELRIEIEKKYQEKTIENVYKDLMDLLKKILGNKSKEKLLQAFEGTLVSTGEFTKQHLRILNDVLKSYNDFKKGKTNANKINRARGDADILMKALVEYAQRKELLPIEKGKVKLKFNDKIIELMNLNENIYFYDGEEIKKVTNKIESSSEEEFRKDFEKQKNKKENSLDPKIFDVLRKEYGEFKIDLL